jgi:exopolyphosphatase/guanosine-5'-triphosphate,3'-diphosphate pyrophosphatase
VARPVEKIPDVLAAVDLGSNSFHMVVARYSHGQLIILDRLREMVRLAAGLDDHDRLNREAVARALACLERFGQRLRDMRAERVRVVGTNTLRKARRKGAFLERAREALGHPIEIISGAEEARLIYLGVAHTTPSDAGRKLVVDIGGGSTELIVGEGLVTRRLESLYIGCVSLTVEHFSDGTITEKRMKRARTAAQLEIEPIAARFRKHGWDAAFGASGTLRAAHEISVARDASNVVIDRPAIKWIIEECLRAGDTSRLRLPGLAADRAEVLPAGLAIIVEIFDMLGIESMRVADGALREGLLYDLLGRLTDEDARVRSVRAMEARYHVDTAQADRVEGTAIAFLQQVREDWGLQEPLAELILRWAARLHEIGLEISHTGF